MRQSDPLFQQLAAAGREFKEKSDAAESLREAWVATLPSVRGADTEPGHEQRAWPLRTEKDDIGAYHLGVPSTPGAANPWGG